MFCQEPFNKVLHDKIQKKNLLTAIEVVIARFRFFIFEAKAIKK